MPQNVVSAITKASAAVTGKRHYEPLSVRMLSRSKGSNGCERVLQAWQALAGAVARWLNSVAPH